MRNSFSPISDDRLELLLHATGRIFFEWDGEVDVVSWSGPCRQLFGIDSDQLAHSLDDWLGLAHPEDRIALAEEIERARSARGPFCREFRVRHRSGGHLSVLCEGRFLPSGPLRMVGMFGDVSARRQADEQLRRAKEAAEAATRAKSAFLANMSHELRTPLNGVIGMIHLLGRTNLDGQQRRYAQAAQASADVLLSLLNDVLDLSKIEAGMLELEAVNFSVADVAEGVAAALALAAEEKHLTLDCHCAPGVVPPLCGDPTRLRQVLVNVVANAIKFTPCGSISLSVKLDEESPTAARVRFEVRDTGIGIAPENQGRLFEAFTQVDPSTTRKYGGSGLGLAICKQLVEAMGGAIGIESLPGEGSLFWFTVRLAKAAGSRSHRQSLLPELTLPVSAGQRLLLVEDNEINAEVVLDALGSAGYTCDHVQTGAAAVEAARERAYALVLMDCQLPEMDGFEAAQRIRAQQGRAGQPHLPIIALTACATRDDRERCLASGMDDYLSKPLRPDDLVRVVAAHLRSHPRLDSSGPVANLSAALERLDGRVGFLRRLARRFLNALPAHVVALRAAADARDLRALAAAAHRLRGEAATFDASPLVASCEAAEATAQRGDVGVCAMVDSLLVEIGRLKEVLSAFEGAQQEWPSLTSASPDRRPH